MPPTNPVFNKTDKTYKTGISSLQSQDKFILAVATTIFFLSHREINELSVFLSCLSSMRPGDHAPQIRHDSESNCGVKGVRCVGGSDSSIEKGNLSSFFFSILFQIPLTQLTNLTLREIDTSQRTEIYVKDI